VTIKGITFSSQNEGFRSSREHVMAELKRIELRLQLKLESLRPVEDSQMDQFHGLYISNKEIDQIIQNSTLRNDTTCTDGTPQNIESMDLISRLEQDIISQKTISFNRGQELRLDGLQSLFNLSQFDIDALLICLLPEIDLKYQKLYAYLQDDITKKSPTVDLILQLLCDTNDSRLEARDRFSPESPLVKYGLVKLSGDNLSKTSSLLSEFIQIDTRITDFLFESDHIDNRLIKSACLVKPEIGLPDIILSQDTRDRLQKLATYYIDKSLVLCLFGLDESGKWATIEGVCKELGVSLLQVDIENLITSNQPVESLISLIFREGCLQKTALFINGFDHILNEERGIRQLLESITHQIKHYPNWVFLSSQKEWQPRGLLENKTCINIEISPGSFLDRKLIWERHLKKSPEFAADIDSGDLATKFKFTGGQIFDAVTFARNMAKWRDPEKGLVTADDLYSACRKQARETLNTLARKIKPVYRWEDIILPRDQKEQLHEICSYVENYHKVYGTWGFGKKVSLGKGLNILFAGVSGTGKTMAAEVIANELKIDLYKIDLSSIVSKYIGETEKNLDRIFREGQISNAILFFDEADALFGKRSEVKDSHDRYANIEVAYLLQKMDEYEGIVILATNLRKNMDEAFARRMHYTLEFPVPEEPDRYKIWQNIFPKETPLSKEADLKFMARQFKITGGNIKNVALNAAFLAASNGGMIVMEHLIKATKREFQKTGRLCTEGDFGPYFELVKG
jgi:AAA+ superfamily predicted ATPase